MSSIVTHGYGGGSIGQVIPTNGYGSMSSQLSIVPASGSMLGGDAFSITSTGLSVAKYIDNFQTITSYWTTTTVDSATLVASNGLKLGLGLAGGLAMLSSDYMCSSVDLTIKYAYSDSLEKLHPQAVTFCGLRLRADSSVECSISHMWDPTLGSIIKADVISDSVIRQSNYIKAKSTSGYLTIKRHEGKVQMYAGATLVLEATGWTEQKCFIDIYSSSAAIPQATETTVSNFTPRPVVLFNSVMAEGVVEYDQLHIAGHSPLRLQPGEVDVDVVLIDYEVRLPSKYLYTAPPQLTISKQQSTVTINNDRTLRDIG